MFDKTLNFIKFIYSEIATKFCEIFTLLLSYVVWVKGKVKISQNFVTFSEYMNFTAKDSIEEMSASTFHWMKRRERKTFLFLLFRIIAIQLAPQCQLLKALNAVHIRDSVCFSDVKKLFFLCLLGMKVFSLCLVFALVLEVALENDQIKTLALTKDSFRYGWNTPHWSLKIWNQ